MSTHFAFVTLVTSDSYLPGALAVLGALKDVHQTQPHEVKYDTVCMVTPETLDITTIKLLRKTYDIVIGVEVIGQSDPAGLYLLGRPDLDTVLTKLHVFRLTQYFKVIFLDADVLPLRPLSHLFHLDHEFSAVPDVGWPDIFNSGVMVLTPGEDKFKELQELLKTNGSWDGGDQGILNEWRGDNWNRLSFTYNTTPTAAYTYAPAYERFGSQISVVHFIGPNKPWHSIPYRAPGSSTQVPSEKMEQQSPESELATQPQQAYDYGSLVDRWYGVYDKHFRSKPISSDLEVPVSKYVSAWEDETNTRAGVESAGTSSGGPLGLDVLRRLALQGMGVMGFRSSDRSKGEGEYKSMPLEGRLDLMRPRLPKQKKPEENDPHQSATEPADSIISEAVAEPTTPVRQIVSLSLDSPVRWATLPTPNIDEVPPAPQARLLSLPPTPLHFVSPPSKPVVRGNQPKSPLSLQERRMERSRPTSPPLLSWNAAVEAPPKTIATPSALPRDTYFPNAWDDSPTRNKDPASSSRSSSSTSSETDATSTEVSPVQADPSPQTLFSPPPVPEIPQMLLQLGHYRNVTGPSSGGGTAPPTPDRTKVKRVFPWEERPRVAPARVFPEGEPRPQGLMFLQSPPRSAALPSTPERKLSREFGAHQPMPSPLAGFPSLTSANMWDAVPGIHKFASKLARPPGPTPLATAFENPKKPWEEKSEASSHDGDVEDEMDSDEDEGKQTVTEVRSRSSSIATAGKKYQSFGVQTDVKEMCSQSVQVVAEEDVGAKRSLRARKPSGSTKKQWHPSSSLRVLPPAMDVAAGAEPSSLLSPAISQVSTPRFSVTAVAEDTDGMIPSAVMGSPGTPPPQTPGQPGETTPRAGRSTTSSPLSSPSRLFSSESPTSSSLGPASPYEGRSPGTPSRASRVWDPARGVDLFKRGSEEVLARFLKISSREEPTRRI
ncbi:glycosyltransferase family 8 protein [Suillus clintonianus]|uniref:glycosyltransferase family 8 protein n=1 Tax=Suillus clintonianus TaxID=1904413 RepID=UPI001B8771F9|nr:glycosyltransferase family 8 protein [Suillus clintonianus]KAG2155595.1 glycosyltransferase family 8 protein [Suillus clintonianus]